MPADATLILHVSAGTAAMAAGWTALLTRKGGRVHRTAGTVFVIAMLTMALLGAGLALTLPRAPWTNVTASVFAIYLVATSWMSVRRPAGRIGRFEVVASTVPLVIVLVALALAVTTLGTPRAAGFAAVYVFAGLAAIASICDIRLIQRGELSGPARIARHLWRMGLALVLALTAFFLGQQKVFPEALRGGLLPTLPVLGALALTLFWLVRTRQKARRLAPAVHAHGIRS